MCASVQSAKDGDMSMRGCHVWRPSGIHRALKTGEATTTRNTSFRIKEAIEKHVCKYVDSPPMAPKRRAKIQLLCTHGSS